MNVSKNELPGVLVIEPDVFGDERGYFLESWRKARYAELGIRETFVQDNVSFSAHGVLRGLHCQNPNSQGKLVTVLEGEVFDVAVDIRRGSPAFGRWMGVALDGKSKRQVYVPPGFAHGFIVTSETALFLYKCTDIYNPQAEFSVAWDDPDIGVTWPAITPTLSEKDRQAPRLRDIPEERLPLYNAE